LLFFGSVVVWGTQRGGGFGEPGPPIDGAADDVGQAAGPTDVFWAGGFG
jgi:hypothetical protein